MGGGGGGGGLSDLYLGYMHVYDHYFETSDDPGLTLTYFIAWLNLVSYGGKLKGLC